MTPERMARVVARWVRFYTHDLPAAVAQRRVEEIDADLHDHIAHERDAGTGDRRIALSIAARMVRGLGADAAWRMRTTAVSKPRRHRSVARSVLRVAIATALVLLVPLVAMQFGDEANWTPGDFLFAAVLLTGAGLLLELAARRPGSIALRAVAAAIGVAAVALGEAGDAPGLVLFGCLLIAGTVALGVRAAWRSE